MAIYLHQMQYYVDLLKLQHSHHQHICNDEYRYMFLSVRHETGQYISEQKSLLKLEGENEFNE